MFMLKCVLLVVLMFTSALYGIHYANKGIVTMRGYEPYATEGTSEDNIQTAIFGQDKKEQLEEIETYNFFSTAGKKLSHTVTQLTKMSLEKINELMTDQDR